MGWHDPDGDREFIAHWVNHSNVASINNDINITSATDHGTGDFSWSLTVLFTGTSGQCQHGNTRGTSTPFIHWSNTDRDATNVLAENMKNRTNSLVDAYGSMSAGGVIT